MIKEVTVVGNTDHCTFVLLQVLLEPVDRLCVQVVGRLIKQQHIRLLQEETTECHTTAFTSREMLH